MDTNALKKFAAAARNLLIDQVTSKLDLVLAVGAPARREHPRAVTDLENAIRKTDRKQVIEQVAYTWFNRFTALRFMDANGYTQVRVVSPADGATRPEILTEALAGNIPEGAPGDIAALLEGRTPSGDPQAEAYRLLLVHACNGWHKHMPFLFEEIDDFTELLMPEDLLSQSSILAELRAVMTEDACKDVEIIGWLYQFYISEKKDQVFAGLKQNKKITAENIPAATQLFTPHWIVRYLVENSLGRLWLLNRPQSRLAERMDYYIAPEEPETDFLKITKPEEIRICDPAAGSGHMLTYAFDLLYAIYEEEGYERDTIPVLILTHNLTGVEIDDRAGALAAFALAMKAAARLGRRRFLRMEAKPDICVLQPSNLTLDEVWQLWSQLPDSFNDIVADLRPELRGLPGFIEDVEHALQHTRDQLEHASSAEAIMARSAQFDASLDRSLKFFDELATNSKIGSAYDRISKELWQAIGNRHPWASVEQCLKEFRKSTGATETSRRLEDIMVALMKPTGPSDEHMNALSHFQSRLKHAAMRIESAAFFREKLTALRNMMHSCLHLLADVRQFEQAKNFGSLIVPKLRDPAETLRVVEARDFGGDLLLKEVQERVVAVLRMAEALSPKYHVVVANPPYMGGKGMNPGLASYLAERFPSGKSDLFSAFVLRSFDLLLQSGTAGIMCPNVWMYLSSYEILRSILSQEKTITNLFEMPLSGFQGATVQICGFNFLNKGLRDTTGSFMRLVDVKGGEKEVSNAASCAIKGEMPSIVYEKSPAVFPKIPGSPIAYWASERLIKTFEDFPSLASFARPKQGLATTDNDRFLRHWSECCVNKICFSAYSSKEFEKSGASWAPCQKGGEFRKWFGNNELVVNWRHDGADIKSIVRKRYGSVTKRVVNEHLYFQEGLTWSSLSSSRMSMRYVEGGFIFETKGSMCFFDDGDTMRSALGALNSSTVYSLNQCLSPTLDFHEGPVGKLPIPILSKPELRNEINRLIHTAKSDWDAFETSWDFTTLPLLSPDHRGATLEDSYAALRAHWQSMTDEMQRMEEENNRIFIDAYGLQGELPPEVPIEEITLTCNPAYRYGIKNDAAANETRLRADTMAEFLSYAVGCMFGRYSLDSSGLILANQGETLQDYLARVPEPTFTPDADNVIPVLDENWFPDDIVERFRVFLRTTFGEAHFRENLKFIEDALGKDIRKYFTRDFYAAHVQRYKKRPIYWMFSSPKGTFNALIYMHRYRGDTVSVLLNDYLREFITKLEGERARLDKLADDPTATQGQRTKAVKDAAKLATQIDELHEWEREVVFPLAQQKIEIDLDDGVKANYPKFGAALKKIPGLSE